MSELPSFLSNKLLCHADVTWKALAVNANDAKVLSALLFHPTPSSTYNYLELAFRYIQENSDLVCELETASQQFSDGIWSGALVDPDAAITTVSGRQSLLYFRAVAGFLASDPRRIAEKLRFSGNSNFVRSTFVRTLIYFAANNATEDALELHLSHVVRGGQNAALDSAVLRFLISDEFSKDYPLGFKCYVALLAHPYDALHILLAHFERVFAQKGELPRGDISRLEQLEGISSSRLNDLLSNANHNWPEYRDAPARISRMQSATIPTDVHDYFLRVVQTRPFHAAEHSTELLTVFDNMRSTRYPNRREFDIVMTYITIFRFTEAGRFLEALMSALYLTPRMDAVRERITVIRLISILECICPFVVGAPDCLAFLDSSEFSGLRARFADLPSACAEKALSPSIESSDRLWMHSLHLRLYEPMKSGQMTVWSRTLRQCLPLAPGYLSGVKWEWFQEVLKVVRVGPFRGNADGIFVLLWEVMETKRTDLGTLRVAVEPIAAQHGAVQSFADWLFSEFGVQAICFFQYFLSAGTLMRLKFTDNYFEALSERSVSIERYVQKFGHSDLFTEEQFHRELEQFNTELLLLQVGANQFEIAWGVLTADATVKLDDVYKSVKAFEARPEDKTELLGEAKFDFDHHFGIGVHLSCAIRAKDSPLATLVIGLIEAFMQHPSQGLESILSVRIRHLNFLRQFEQAFQNLRHQPTFPSLVRSSGCMDSIERPALQVVQDWLESRLHQKKLTKPNGVFNFVPSDAEFRDLIASSRGKTLSDVCALVFTWINGRLEENLKTIRDESLQDLRKNVLLALDSKKAIASHPELGHLIPNVIAELHTTVVDLISSLSEWFKTAAVGSDDPTSALQMELVLRGRYQTDIEQKRLAMRLRSENLSSFPIQRQKVRTIFDLCCEVVNNCLRYGTKPKVILNIVPYSEQHEDGLLFVSTQNPKLIVEENEIAGSPSDYSNPALFREGKTGLEKIAALAASVAGQPVRVKVDSRGSRYLIKVPLIVR